MEWNAEDTQFGTPCAVLKDGNKVIIKVYLSPDHLRIRFVLPEFVLPDQFTVKADGVVDFKRKV